MGVIYFAIMIGVLVTVHELGHFLAARYFKVGVTQFAVGMGPRLWTRTRGGTEYFIGALPLGGYVMMAQHDDEVNPSEKPLPSAGLWPRAVIALAGPVFSLLFALPCYFLVGLGTATVPAPIVANMPAAERPSAAAEAGMVIGDEITAINGHTITYWHDISPRIQDSGGAAIEITVMREGEPRTVTVTPTHVPGHGYLVGISHVPVDSDGQPLADQIVTRDMAWGERLSRATSMAVLGPWRVSKRVVTTLGGMITGQVSTKQLGGPIMIFNAASDAGRDGWTRFLLLMGVITVNLGLINLLPIPILDGGRLILIGVEAVQRRPLSMRTQQLTAMVGMAMVVALMVLAFKNDIERYWDRFAGWLS